MGRRGVDEVKWDGRMEGGADILASQREGRDRLHMHTPHTHGQTDRTLKRWAYKSQGISTDEQPQVPFGKLYTVQLSARLDNKRYLGNAMSAGVP